MEGLVFVNQHLHSNAFFNHLMKFITLLGDGGIVWIALAVVLLFFKKTRFCGLTVIISLAIGYVLNDFVLKLIFSRPRPFSVHPEFVDFLEEMKLELPGGFSFPSGHAFSSFNCAVVMLLFHKRIGIFAIILAALISFSRIFFCVHYPTDVLAGMILGIVVAVVVSVSVMKIIKSFSSRKRLEIRR